MNAKILTNVIGHNNNFNRYHLNQYFEENVDISNYYKIFGKNYVIIYPVKPNYMLIQINNKKYKINCDAITVKEALKLNQFIQKICSLL